MVEVTALDSRDGRGRHIGRSRQIALPPASLDPHRPHDGAESEVVHGRMVASRAALSLTGPRCAAGAAPQLAEVASTDRNGCFRDLPGLGQPILGSNAYVTERGRPRLLALPLSDSAIAAHAGKFCQVDARRTAVGRAASGRGRPTSVPRRPPAHRHRPWSGPGRSRRRHRPKPSVPRSRGAR